MDTLHDVLHSIINHFIPHEGNDFRPHLLQRGAFLGLLAMVVLTFTLANFQALLWQSSQWLVGAVLPAVVIDLTNVQRQENNLSTLTRNPVLDAAANLKAQDMARNSYFAHNSPTGVSPWHWFEQAGYSYVYAGENLAVYFTDSSAVVDAWMKSPTHRANIVGPHYTEIGVGTAKGTYNGFDTVFVVQLFGAPGIKPTPQPVAVKPVVARTPVVQPVPVRTLATTSASTTRARVAPLAARAVLGAEIAPVPTTTKKAVLAATHVEGRSDEIPLPATAETAADATTTPAAVPATVETITPATSGVDDAFITPTTFTTKDFTVVESGMATSHTNLQPAPIASVEKQLLEPVPTTARLATEPNRVLQTIYIIIGIITMLALFASVIIEWRQHRPVQTVYGLLLLLLMCGLFVLHTTLTAHVLVV